jgi:hypothetical protein
MRLCGRFRLYTLEEFGFQGWGRRGDGCPVTEQPYDLLDGP